MTVRKYLSALVALALLLSWQSAGAAGLPDESGAQRGPHLLELQAAPLHVLVDGLFQSLGLKVRQFGEHATQIGHPGPAFVVEGFGGLFFAL